jgi:hypothetical protein
MRHPKVDFGFQVASQSPLCAAQSRLWFLSRILKSPHCRHIKSTSVASKVCSDSMTTFQATQLDAKLLLGISQARGLRTNNYSTWLIWLSYLEGYRCKSTRMMAFANTEDLWIDYLIISRLGDCYATPIIQFFRDGRFRIKIDPQLESTTQPKARGLLHMECDFATALPYNLDFKTNELDHLPASW